MRHPRISGTGNTIPVHYNPGNVTDFAVGFVKLKTLVLLCAETLFFYEDLTHPVPPVAVHPSREGINPGRPIKVLLYYPLPWRGAENGGVGLAAVADRAVVLFLVSLIGRHAR